jgi:hypothetical protein
LVNHKEAVLTAGLLVLSLLLTILQFSPSVNAQAETNFNTEDRFSIPETNGTLSFALNGSYTSATLENDTWIFKNLKLNSQNLTFLGLNATQGLDELKFSTQNSNVTVWTCFSVNYTLPVVLLSYYAEGVGNQTVNLGLNASQPSSSEWSVIVSDSVFLPEGDDWRLLPDSSLLVWGRTGNVTVAHFGFTGEYKNLSFFLQHYVGIFTAVFLAAVISVSLLIRAKIRRAENLKS